MGLDLWLADEIDPFMDQGLPRPVFRMCLAGDDELHRALRISQKAQQTRRVVQQQIRSLVGCEAPRKAQGQCIGIKQMFRHVNLFGRRARGSQLPGQSLASVFNKRLAGGEAKLPEFGIAEAANVLLQGFRRPQPAAFPTAFRPKIIGRGRVPGRHVHSVSDMSDRHFVGWPVGKKRLKEVPADYAMQTAHPIHRPAAADCQIGHVETLRRVARILAAQGQQILKGDAEFLLGMTAEVLFDECRRETIEAGGHCRVSGEEITRSCGRQCDFEGLPCLFHEVVGALQNGERRMAFIQMTDFRLDAQRTKQPPSADPEEQFLLEAQLRPAAIQLAGNPPMNGVVCRVIAVQQVELHSADLDLPGAQPDRVSGQRDLQPQPLPVCLAQRRDRQLSGIVVWVEGLLLSISVDHLAKIALLVQQSHSDHWHAQIAGGFELVAGHIAKPARVDGQSFAQHEFHAEICGAG